MAVAIIGYSIARECLACGWSPSGEPEWSAL
jgi:hypothetical protein